MISRRSSPVLAFSLLEVVIAMTVLCAFLLPFFLHFTSVRRTSLAARDTVTANAFLLSCLSEVQALPFQELVETTAPPIHPTSPMSTLTSILTRYCRPQTVGPVSLDTKVTISKGIDPRLRIIDLKTTFRFPGSPEGRNTRELTLRGFKCEPPL